MFRSCMETESSSSKGSLKVSLLSLYTILNPIQDIFEAAHGWGEGKKTPRPP